MRAILPYIVLKPSLLMSLIPLATILLPITRAERALNTWPSYRTLPLGIRYKASYNNVASIFLAIHLLLATSLLLAILVHVFQIMTGP